MLVKTEENQRLIVGRDLVEKTRFEHEQAEIGHLERERSPLTPDAAGMDVANAEQRAGRPMSAWSLQQKLSKIAPFLYFELSKNDPSKTGVYIKLGKESPFLYRGSLSFVCGMESGVMPEFSVIEAEAHVVPDPEAVGGERLEMGMAREIRGWRSVLANLLKRHILTAGDIERYFQITMGRDSQRWQELLQGRMELMSDETEVTENGGTNQGTVDEDGIGSGARNRAGRAEDGNQSVDGRHLNAHQGGESAGRRNGSEEGGRGSQAPATNGGDVADCQDRGSEPDQSSVQLQPS